MSSLYQGWDVDFDRQFDSAALTFCLTDPMHPDVIAATLKIIDRSQLPSGGRLPLELADESPVSAARGAIEASGFALRDRRAARRLCEAFGFWLHLHGKPDVYSCYDKDNPLTRRLFLRHVGLVETNAPELQFDSIVSRRTGAPARWRLLVDEAASRPPRLEACTHLHAEVKGLVPSTLSNSRA